jgi:N-acetylglutamate synthase-like GNAT family acetyltransferase
MMEQINMTEVRVATSNDEAAIDRLCQLEDLTLIPLSEHKTFVATHENEVIGTITVCQNDSSAQVVRIIVAPEHRRKGIGRNLLDAITANLQPGTRITASTTDAAVSGFFEKCAFSTFIKMRKTIP